MFFPWVTVMAASDHIGDSVQSGLGVKLKNTIKHGVIKIFRIYVDVITPRDKIQRMDRLRPMPP